jgi:hypothetical protein
MKSKTFIFGIVVFILLFLTPKVLADTPRPIAASSVYNTLGSTTNPGYLYIPTTTPLSDRACYFDDSSTIGASVTTATELTYLHGVTSPIQAQINSITRSSRTVNTVSSNFTVPSLMADYILNANTTSFGFTVTLPDAVASSGLCVDVKNIGSPAHTITVATQGGQTIDGSATTSITSSMDSDHLCAVGGNWFIY